MLFKNLGVLKVAVVWGFGKISADRESNPDNSGCSRMQYHYAIRTCFKGKKLLFKDICVGGKGK